MGVYTQETICFFIIYMDEIYTGPKRREAQEVYKAMKKRFPNMPQVRVLRRGWTVRKLLIKYGAVRLSSAQKFTVENRDVIPALREKLMAMVTPAEFEMYTNASAPLPAAPAPTAPAPTAPDPPPAFEKSNGSYTDRVIIAMANTIKQLRAEIAELIDERAKSLQQIHEASRMVVRSQEMIKSCTRLPAGVDLNELGIGEIPKEDWS